MTLRYTYFDILQTSLVEILQTDRQCKTLKTKPEDHYMQTKKYLATAEKLCNAFNPE